MRNDRSQSIRSITIIIFCLMIFDLVALTAYTFPVINALLLPIFVLTIWYCIARDERALLLVPLAELMWGSFGASFQWHIGGFRLSLRIVIFIVCVLYWAWHRSKGRLTPVRSFKRDVFQYAMLSLPAVWACIRGLSQGHAFGAIFFDGNAYLYLLYIPLWHLVYDQKMIGMLRSLCVGIAMALSIKTLVLMNIFTNQYDALNVQYLYLWLRDTRVGEITATGTTMWRIFMQSQLYIGIVLMHILIEALYDKRVSIYQSVSIAFLGAGIIASMSRSFWLGLFTSIGIMFGIVLVRRVMSFNELIQFSLRIITALVGSVIIVAVLIFIPGGGKDLSSSFIDRFAVDDAAGSSRAQLLDPLIAAVRQHPIIGQGFGAVVTYRSNDPRIKNVSNPEGLITTAAFEWGYLDQWLKWGLIGMLFWTFVIIRQFIRGYTILRSDSQNSVWVASLLAGFVFILIVHVVSPYLNHPLGIGYILLTMLVLQHSVETYHG